MPSGRLTARLAELLGELEETGRAKAPESAITAIVPASGRRGPRVRIAGGGERPFLRMNSNGYLGVALRTEIIAAEEAAARKFGTGPGAVRFIGGTYAPHVELERRLAAFHGREAALTFSSAYAAVVGTLVPLITPETVVLSDALNHNSIINALMLARPAAKYIYAHLDPSDVADKLAEAKGRYRRALVVTDGVFSMRGDHAPLAEISAVAKESDAGFPENVLVVVDDSHGAGVFGATGRGTEEHTGARADVLIATLGKAFGVNGGYVAAEPAVIEFLRQTSAFYVYSNPITAAEAAAAVAAVDVVDSANGQALLGRVRAAARRFRTGARELGYEVLEGKHPIVPLMVRDTRRTAELVEHLGEHGILVTGLNHPVVPRGDEEIRVQLSAEHTDADVDEALAALASFPGRRPDPARTK